MSGQAEGPVAPATSHCDVSLRAGSAAVIDLGGRAVTVEVLEVGPGRARLRVRGPEGVPVLVYRGRLEPGDGG